MCQHKPLLMHAETDNCLRAVCPASGRTLYQVKLTLVYRNGFDNPTLSTQSDQNPLLDPQGCIKQCSLRGAGNMRSEQNFLTLLQR